MVREVQGDKGGCKESWSWVVGNLEGVDERRDEAKKITSTSQAKARECGKVRTT